MDFSILHHHRTVRQRRSLHERSLSNATKPRNKRRVERYSLTAAPSASMELSLLEHVQVQFIKAFVPANKLSRPRYVMKVTNVALQQSWDMVRPFKEFYDLKEDLLRELDHGHLCHSNCPWLFMFVSHHFPRRHLFRERSAGVVSARLTELGEFLNTLLRATKDNRSLECSISSQAVPKVLYAFLFEGMVFDRADFTNTILETRQSLGALPQDGSSSRLSITSSSNESCTICRRALRTVDSCSSMSTISDDASMATFVSSSGNSSSSDQSSVASLTTLECGHCFHDECILAKLNENLQCPLCAEEEEAAVGVEKDV